MSDTRCSSRPETLSGFTASYPCSCVRTPLYRTQSDTRPADATEATRVSLCPLSKLSPPVFWGSMRLSRNGKHMVPVRGGQAGLLDKPPPTERQRFTPSRVQPPHRQHRKRTQIYLNTTDVMGLITAEVLQTMFLSKRLGVHSNSGAILDLPMPH